MTVFDYIKDILVTKNGNLSLDGYVPYLINRWLSFINPVVSEYVNLLNTKNLLDNKEMHYRAAISLFPKMNRAPKITYIKKQKHEQTEKDEKITYLAQSLEISRKEVEFLLENAVDKKDGSFK